MSRALDAYLGEGVKLLVGGTKHKDWRDHLVGFYSKQIYYQSSVSPGMKSIRRYSVRRRSL